MKEPKKICNFPAPVCFLDGFRVRHGVALGACRGVWRVRCEDKIWTIWEDDIFGSVSAAVRVANSALN